ncbi:MAG: tetratricopeptide repeat protein [Candidatus Latescibacterota bacterium]
MKIRIFGIIFCLLTLSHAAQGSPVDIHQFSNMDGKEPTSPLQSIEAEDVLALLYRGMPNRAIALADRHIEANPANPLPYIMKARTLREILPEQDDNKDLIRENAEPIHDVLDQAIQLCNLGLKKDDDDLQLRFYRGWAWMCKAQLHALGGSYWSAGRSAAKGNKDLQTYISKHPDDPDAKGVLGTFLYFADTLPSAIKVIKTLFFIPGGDRRKGLEYLRYACSHESLLQTEHQIVLAAVYTIFEGRFEEGVSAFTTLIESYPDYLRLVEPLAIVRTFYPSKMQHLVDIERSAIARCKRSSDCAFQEETITRLRYHGSYYNMFFESPSLAIDEFASLIEEAPARPDWLIPLSLVNLGCLYANSGRMDEACAAFNRVVENKNMKHFHDIASQMLEAKSSSLESLMAGDNDFIHNIYLTDPQCAYAGLENYHRTKGPTVLYEFYHGESLLLAGDFAQAALHFQNAIDQDVPGYSQAYQMLAAVRMAEIKGMQGDYDAAGSYLDKGLSYYHKEFLVDMLIEGRKRYYERLKKGELKMEPSVLLATPLPDHSSQRILD